ncbi:hypothetical protein YC2023_120487 [Brassica napus]
MHLNSHLFFSLLVNQIRSSQKLKGIMKRILYLGNTLNQGTVRALSDTRAANSKMTLMHYLCKVKYNLKKKHPLENGLAQEGGMHNLETLLFLSPGLCF